MKKLLRFVILGILFFICLLGAHCLIPLAVMLFGGGFMAVATHPIYVALSAFCWSFVFGMLFNDCFTNEGYSAA